MTHLIRRILTVVTLVAGAAAVGAPGVPAQPTEATVYIIPITGAVELGLSGFLKRAVADAKRDQAQAIILEIDTFGGRVDAAVEICRIMSDAKPLRTIAYVTNQAWSAGALIALACDQIVMAPGSSIGSAEPRLGVGASEEATDEKSISAVRAKFHAVAEEHGHHPQLAEAMVDQDVELKLVRAKDRTEILTTEEIEQLKEELRDRDIEILRTVKAKEKLLNLAAGEAHELGLAAAVVPNRETLLEQFELASARIVEPTPTWSEWLVRWVTHPIASSLLLSLGMLGIFVETRTPGFGVPGILGGLCIVLFFWGHYLIGLAQWTDVVLFAGGLLLLIVELFALPGFGLVGAAGAFMMLVGLFLGLIKYPVVLPEVEFARAFYTVSYAFIATTVLGALSIKLLPHTTAWKRLILREREDGAASYTSADARLQRYAGKSGHADTDLRPSGRARIGDDMVDVVSEGDFIVAGSPIRVIQVDGGRVVVARDAADARSA